VRSAELAIGYWLLAIRAQRGAKCGTRNWSDTSDTSDSSDWSDGGEVTLTAGAVGPVVKNHRVAVRIQNLHGPADLIVSRFPLDAHAFAL